MKQVYLLILILFLFLLINQRNCIEGYVSMPDNYNNTGGTTMSMIFNNDEHPNNGCDYFIDENNSTKYYCIDNDLNKEKYYLDLTKCQQGDDSGIWYNDNLHCKLIDQRFDTSTIDDNITQDCNSFASEGNYLNAICKVQDGIPTSCYNALKNCSNTDVFKCSQCAGSKQQKLEEAGCSNDNIAKWCSNQVEHNSLFYKNSLPINDLNSFKDIKYDSVNEILYYMNKGNRINASKINLKIPPFKLWGDESVENGNSIACSINDKCICKADLCTKLGYHWSGPAGDQICTNTNTGKIVNHKELCKQNKGIFKSSYCFTQQNVDCTP